MTFNPWIQTVSGRSWDINYPKSDQIHWPDIAESLAKICRFNGYSTAFYSVAQHCCLVANMLPPQHQLYGLLHDAHEAILGELTSPVKAALSNLCAYDGFKYLTKITDSAIFEAAGLKTPMSSDAAVAVKHADLTLLATERRDLMAESQQPWAALPDPLSKHITPWAPGPRRWRNGCPAYPSPAPPQTPATIPKSSHRRTTTTRCNGPTQASDRGPP